MHLLRYDAVVLPARLARLILLLAASLALVPHSAAASASRRSHLPAGEMSSRARFEQALVREYEPVVVRRAAFDVDRDGDLDVISVSNRTVTVWINDGSGHFASQAPDHSPALTGEVRLGFDDDDNADCDDGVPDDTVPACVELPPAHAPPGDPVVRTVAASTALPGSFVSTVRFTRGPPR